MQIKRESAYKQSVAIYKQAMTKGKSPAPRKPEQNQAILNRFESDKKNLQKLHDRLSYITNNYYIKNLKIENASKNTIHQQKLTQSQQIRQPRGQSATLEAKRSEKKMTRQYESLQPKKAQTDNSFNLERLLLKQQQQSKVPNPVKRTLWHSFLNQPTQQRRVKSQLSVKKEVYSDASKNRSAQSLHAGPQEFASFSLIYSVRTRQGVLASNPNKVNQDIYICEANIAPDVHLFTVCDGHGQNGHLVSQFVKQNFPLILQSDNQILSSVKDAVVKSIQNVANKVNHSTFDTQFSGTTMNVVIIQDGGKVLCANVGDSRAIVGKSNGKGKFRAVPLSTDHKPCLAKEQQRIRQCGGRVDSYYDQEGNPIGPSRVWVSNGNYPGLAMSRSLGDQVAASVGVSSVPETMEYQLSATDKFIIVASDGVWEFIDNQTVVDLVGKYYIKSDIDGASEELMRAAYKMWTVEDDSVIDDITFIIIFIQQD